MFVRHTFACHRRYFSSIPRVSRWSFDALATCPDANTYPENRGRYHQGRRVSKSWQGVGEVGDRRCGSKAMRVGDQAWMPFEIQDVFCVISTASSQLLLFTMAPQNISHVCALSITLPGAICISKTPSQSWHAVSTNQERSLRSAKRLPNADSDNKQHQRSLADMHAV